MGNYRRRGKRQNYTTAKGTEVRSKLEVKVLNELDSKGVKYEYEPKQLEWYEHLAGAICNKCNGKKVSKLRHYLPDVILATGIVLEIKGRFTARDRKLIRGIKDKHRKLDIRLVFDRDNLLSKRSATKYSDWCKKYKVKCAFRGSVPPDWLKGSYEQG